MNKCRNRGHYRAHPRACGENVEEHAAGVLDRGSSPRVRGKYPGHCVLLCAGRLIPARAGKTRPRTACGTWPRAHPRACGENPARLAACGITGGSSPRVRGKPCYVISVTVPARLIPACAGKTSSKSNRVPPASAHPRVCGENRAAACWRCQPSGSSPRVRGKLSNMGSFQGCSGLIPACAGKTSVCLRWNWVGRAHPRVCGENVADKSKTGKVDGSSPRVRGKPKIHSWASVDDRLIPACAGKTLVNSPNEN